MYMRRHLGFSPDIDLAEVVGYVIRKSLHLIWADPANVSVIFDGTVDKTWSQMKKLAWKKLCVATKDFLNSKVTRESKDAQEVESAHSISAGLSGQCGGQGLDQADIDPYSLQDVLEARTFCKLWLRFYEDFINVAIGPVYAIFFERKICWKIHGRHGCSKHCCRCHQRG